jgi:hypothetical protein
MNAILILPTLSAPIHIHFRSSPRRPFSEIKTPKNADCCRKTLKKNEGNVVVRAVFCLVKKLNKQIWAKLPNWQPGLKAAAERKRQERKNKSHTDVTPNVMPNSKPNGDLTKTSQCLFIFIFIFGYLRI